jgi:hypothetical protein
MKKLLLILIALPMIGFGQQLTHIPDSNFEQFLENNFNSITATFMGDGIANNQYVTTANINTATHLLGQLQNITDLTGIEDFTDLTFLTLTNNNILQLDVSNNLDLVTFYCDGNQLTSLDVSNNLDLVTFFCANNHLTSLDLRNGNNTNLLTFNAANNPNLFCIDVDDPVYSTNNWTNIDAQHYFSNNCSTTAIEEHTTNKELLKVTDLLGRETKGTNQPLFYIYDDGKVEKRIVIE